MKEITFESQVAKIEKFYWGFTASHLIHIGDKLGLFEVLNANKNGLTISELIKRLNNNILIFFFYFISRI